MGYRRKVAGDSSTGLDQGLSSIKFVTIRVIGGKKLPLITRIITNVYLGTLV